MAQQNKCHQHTLPLLPHSPTLQRLLNCLGSLSRARAYLLASDGLVRRLFQRLQSEADDTPARRHLLGALQKLSLKRRGQVEMKVSLDMK